MAADTASTGSNDIVCPDPSVHAQLHKQPHLQEAASKAALLATQHQRSGSNSNKQQAEDVLDADGKLSSRSAATSLKHANPQDLPSFPSNGNTANSASKAALLANNYKMDPLWQPETSKAGSKAALLANQKGGNVDLWQASATSDGHSAATLAMQKKGLIPNANYGVTDENKKKALQAATMSASRSRQRADSTPSQPAESYPDANNSAANALNAATKVSSAGWDSPANQAARIKNSHLDPALVGSKPPVEIERDEERHQAALRASAITMAKQIMETQDRTAMTVSADPADIAGAQTASARASSSVQPDIKQEAMRYINLQEAAHKLAEERLAKIDKGMEDSRYREHYGYGDNKSKRLSSRLSMRSAGGRQRTRASSQSAADLDDSDDEEQAMRIRSQMSQLNSGVSRLDEKKQQDDRARLLAAAEKKVAARMHKMDEQVFADTGKVPPSLMEEWEEKARVRAQVEREQRAQNPGKTHIGGGAFMDQSEIDAIAAARLKPTLDEINASVEKRRQIDENIRLKREEQEVIRQQEKEKQRAQDEEWNRLKREDKDEKRRIKNEEKARKDEEKRIAKENERKSREIRREEAKDAAAAGSAGAVLAEVADKVKEDEEPAPAAAEGVQRHRSALGRLKDRFRKSQAGPTEGQQEEKEAAAVDGVAENNKQTTPLPVATTPAVEHEEKDVISEPVATQPTVESTEPTPEVRISEPVDEDDADDEDDESSRYKTAAVPTTAALMAAAAAHTSPRGDLEDADTEEDKALPSSKPNRPAFEQKPSLSGYHNDEIPLADKPDLERHISHIPESDGDSDEEDWNDERETARAGDILAQEHADETHERQPADATLGEDRARVIAERATETPIVAVTKGSDPPIPAESTMAQLDDQRAEPPKQGLPSTGTATANRETLPVTGEEDQRDHSILRGVEAHGQKDFEQRDVAVAPVVVPVDDSQPKASSEHSKLKKKQDTSEPAADDEKEKKGLRGLLSKFRHKDSKSESKERPAETEQSKPSTTVAAAPLPPVDAGPSLGDHVGTDGPIGDDKQVSGIDGNPKPQDPLTSDAHEPVVGEDQRVGTDGPIGDSKHVSGIAGNPRPESPSSFKRGEGAVNDPDDVSSSGADEDDVARGRGGRFIHLPGTKKNQWVDTRTSTEGNRQSNEGTEDEFQEARDHFDDTLAPPANFTATKSESPSRETRFKEEI